MRGPVPRRGFVVDDGVIFRHPRPGGASDECLTSGPSSATPPAAVLENDERGQGGPV